MTAGEIWISKQSNLPAQCLPPPGSPAEVFDFLGGHICLGSFVDKFAAAFLPKIAFRYRAGDNRRKHRGGITMPDRPGLPQKTT